MRLSIFLTFACATAHIQAEIICLDWALLSPILGLFCHFEPHNFEAAENQTLTTIEAAIQDTKDLVKFDLTHNPAVVAYNFVDQTNRNGIGQGGQYLENVTIDFENVAIGFGKGTSNQIVTLMELTYWNDFSSCLVTGAAGLAMHAQKRVRKRVGLHRTTSHAKSHIADTGSNINPKDAVIVAQQCLTNRFQQLADPLKFQINSTNQKVGSTISNIAALLVPIAAEEQAGKVVDLAIPGSESTTRVVKMVSENTGAHFANEEEAQAVADSMRKESWVKENCRVCGNSPGPLVSLVSRKERRKFDFNLSRRGQQMASCCSLPSVDIGAEVNTADTTSAEVESDEANSIFNPKAYKQLGEADLGPPPQLTARDISVTSDIEALKHDLDTLSTGLTKWTPELMKVKSSDEVLSSLREIFTGKPEDPLYKALKIHEREPGLRSTSFSDDWIYSTDPVLQPLQAWVKAAVQDGVDTFANLRGLHPDVKAYFRGNVEFFFTGPSDKAITGTDPRGFHIDGGYMQFGVADVPGLVVANTASKTASRLSISKNSWHLLKGQEWDITALFDQTANGPTWHSVFGPEIAKEGRVSIIMSVYKPRVSLSLRFAANISLGLMVDMRREELISLASRNGGSVTRHSPPGNDTLINRVHGVSQSKTRLLSRKLRPTAQQI